MLDQLLTISQPISFCQDERDGDRSAGEGEEEHCGEPVGPINRMFVAQLTLRSMRELLEKAHEEDDDEMYKEEADDVEFEVPRELSLSYSSVSAHSDMKRTNEMSTWRTLPIRTTRSS